MMARRGLGGSEGFEGGGREQLQETNRADAHAQSLGQAALGPLGHLRFDDLQDVRDVRHGPGEIVGRERPQRHGRDVQFRTPHEDLVSLVGPEAIAVGQSCEPHIARVPAMPVLD